MPNLYANLIALAVGFASGWKTDSWHNASIMLAQQNSQDKALKVFAAKESTISAMLEVRLRGLKANEKTIELRTKEIIDRPIYHDICIDDDGLLIINAYGESNGGTAESTSEKP